MLILNTTWEYIRGQFSDEEKEQLRAVVEAEAICPPGTMIDETRLPAELQQELLKAIRWLPFILMVSEKPSNVQAPISGQNQRPPRITFS